MRGQAYGHQGGKGGGQDALGDWDRRTNTTMYTIDIIMRTYWTAHGALLNAL